MSLKRLIYALGVIALLGNLLITLVLYLGSWHRAGEQSEAATRNLAEATAASIQRTVSLINHHLDGAAANLASQDLSKPDAVQVNEQHLKSTLPHALIVRILAADTNLLDEARNPKMGFADLEMVKQASAGELAPAAHAVGTPDAHIAFVRSIPGKRGVILASLSLNLLKEALPKLPDGAAMDILQDTLSLASQGDQATQKDTEQGSVPITKSPWSIAYWPPSSHWPSAWWIVALAAALLALTGAAFAMAANWLGTVAKQEQGSLLELVENVIKGHNLDLYPMRLAENQSLAQGILLMRKLVRDRPQDVPSPQEKPPSKDGHEEEPSEIVLESSPSRKSVPRSIFRAYDIRGIVGDTLTPDLVQEIGRAIGSEAHVKGEQRVFVARDGRKSSPDLAAALVKGLQATGRTVVDIGMVPTPLLYFATHVLNGKSGVVVTGSHNPANYNGLKIVIAGDTLAEDEIQKLRLRIESQDFVSGIGRVENRDISSDYIDRILEDMQIGRSMKIVVDAGNGVAGKVAPALLKAMGCDVVELYCDIDGDFPNHHPDPSKPENLTMLIKSVIEEEADLGVAFDGDGDRLGLVDAKGNIIWPDRQMMIFASDVLSRQPGADIIYDVKCSRHLASQIVKNGGRPMMWKTGHSLIKSKMKQTGAMLAGEMSGHIFFKERWFGFDDGIYACARMIEILSGDPRTTDEVFEELPDSVNTPELNVALAEGKSSPFVEKLKALAQFPEARIIDIDGLRVDFVDGWGLVRASNTTPSLVVRFEADNEAALSRIQGIFRELMHQIDPTLDLPF
jgi:phosphomannomutase/phosphoglucomutase